MIKKNPAEKTDLLINAASWCNKVNTLCVYFQLPSTSVFMTEYLLLDKFKFFIVMSKG